MKWIHQISAIWFAWLTTFTACLSWGSFGAAPRGWPKYTPAFLADYIRQVNALGGVVTMDAPVGRDGVIVPEICSVLLATRQILDSEAK